MAPCEGISVRNVALEMLPGGGSSSSQRNSTEYLCGNALGLSGFNCTGRPCVGGTAIGECSGSAGGSGPKGGGSGITNTGAGGRAVRFMMSKYALIALLASLWIAF